MIDLIAFMQRETLGCRAELESAVILFSLLNRAV